MNRKTTPDVLGELMSGAIKQENQLDGKQENNNVDKQVSKEARKPESNKVIKQAFKPIPKQTHFEGMEPPEDPIEISLPKEKATFNLSKAVLNDLEDAWMEIRKLRGDKKISKTDIVEQAVEEAIKDFKLKRELSKFYGKLERNKTTKQ